MEEIHIYISTKRLEGLGRLNEELKGLRLTIPDYITDEEAIRSIYKLYFRYKKEVLHEG